VCFLNLFLCGYPTFDDGRYKSRPSIVSPVIQQQAIDGFFQSHQHCVCEHLVHTMYRQSLRPFHSSIGVNGAYTAGMVLCFFPFLYPMYSRDSPMVLVLLMPQKKVFIPFCAQHNCHLFFSSSFPSTVDQRNETMGYDCFFKVSVYFLARILDTE
jgi:hypothetical protein